MWTSPGTRRKRGRSNEAPPRALRVREDCASPDLPDRKGLELDLKKVFITGTAGFIGFHLARLLLAEGFRVHGFDGMTDYYDVTLKQRATRCCCRTSFARPKACSRTKRRSGRVAEDFQPEVIVHLAAQAGVRYSPRKPTRLSRQQCHRHVQRDGGGAAPEGRAPPDGVDLFGLRRQ